MEQIESIIPMELLPKDLKRGVLSEGATFFTIPAT